MEEWKDIPNYDGIYQVSNMGNVRRNTYRDKRGYLKKAKMLIPQENGKGALQICLKKKRYYVSRLVAEMFLDNPNNYPEVKHIDGNLKNNRADNLEWFNSRINKANDYVIKENHIEIILTNTNEKVLIDKEDYEKVKDFHWHKDKKGYAIGNSQTQKRVQMHRLLLPTNLEVDHKNRNTLDNRKCNLRKATRKENSRNRLLSNNKTGYKGVYKTPWGWKSSLRVNGKQYQSKTFKTFEEAINERKRMEEEYLPENLKKFEVQYES